MIFQFRLVIPLLLFCLVFKTAAAATVSFPDVRAPNGNYLGIGSGSVAADRFCASKGYLKSSRFSTQTAPLTNGYQVMFFQVGCAPQALGGGWTYCGYPGGYTSTTVLKDVTCTNDSVQAASCTFNGTTVASGSSVSSYQASSVPYGSSCAPQTRTCTNGVLSGSYTYSSCTVQRPANCAFNGGTVAHGASVAAYQTSSVSSGGRCVSQTRSCDNGTLSGGYQFASCTLQGNNTLCDASGCIKVSALTMIDAADCKVRAKAGADYVELWDNSCSDISKGANADDYARNFATKSAATGRWRRVTQATGDYTLTSQVGDCTDRLFDVRDEFLGITYSYYIDNACTNVGVQATGSGVMKYVLAQGILPVGNGSEGAWNRCDYRANPSNYLSVLSSIPLNNGNSGPVVSWRGLCLAEGIYTTPIKLMGHRNLAILGAGKDSTKFEAEVLYNSNPSAPIMIYLSRNMVLANLTAHNTHQFYYDLLTRQRLKSDGRSPVTIHPARRSKMSRSSPEPRCHSA